jgi:hypothetical protein
VGSTGKRMYCPKCKKNRTWNAAFKKRQIEPGENIYDFRFFVCKTCEYAYDPKTSLEIPDWRARYYGAESFEAVVVQQRKPKGIIDKVLMQQDMMMRAQLQELTLRLDTDVRLGIISEDQADDIMMSALMKMGLMPADFDAEEWEDIKWNDPPTRAPQGSDWGSDVDWSDDFQSAKALDFLMSLAEGSETTELESRFVLSPRHFSQLQARLGVQFEYLSTLEGFGEGPYPVSQSILSVDEIIAQTEMQLHTIFEAFETVLDGAPSEHDDDHDHDDDDHDHDEFETILELYSPYQPETYRVYVRTSEGVKMMGEFTDVVLAQELADDWNAPGYDDPVAKIEKRLHRNGAFRGLSRVVFEDDSYLTFALLGDLIHRDTELVDMTSLFIRPEAWSSDDNWWETQRNN